MAPRNNDASSSFKKKNYSPDADCEMDIDTIVPCLLHKKHKVVKLVRNQLQKMREEGVLNNIGLEPEGPNMAGDEEVKTELNNEEAKKNREEINNSGRSRQRNPRYTNNRGSRSNKTFSCCYIILFLLAFLLLAIFSVWVSTGPFSLYSPHTPVSSRFLTVDKLQSLEKKNLLRWSKPEYSE